MGRKTERLNIIRNLLEAYQISSQEELLDWLKRVGVDATQSTLSRDMKEIRAVKVPHPEKGYIYMLPDSLQGNTNKLSSVIENIRYIDYSGNIMVMRTKTGFAKAMGAIIDNENYKGMLGTLAGDDTLFILLAEGVDPVAFLPSFDSIHPELKSLYNPDDRKNAMNMTDKVF